MYEVTDLKFALTNTYSLKTSVVEDKFQYLALACTEF